MNGFIGVAGNIGVGKTTFTQILADKFHLKPYFESVIDNPYLSDFYDDMDRWSFHLQIYFLHHRFKTHQAMSLEKRGVVQDRTIYEDVEIFARNLYDMGLMSERDWTNYRDLFSIMISYLEKPQLIVYLRASTDTLLSRIKGRDRHFERSIDPEYLHRLNVAYERWMDELQKEQQVLIVETDTFNVHRDQQQLDGVLQQIESLVT